MRGMYQMFGQFKKQLGQLRTWLTAAGAHAETKKFDPNLFLGFRLAPDQFAFARQVQIACDTARTGALYLIGKPVSAQPETEASLGELDARIASVISFLDGLSATDFEGAAMRVVSQPRWEGKVMSGGDYYIEHVVPNFFFHLNHCYAILRHNGVGLGKKDYLGNRSLRAP